MAKLSFLGILDAFTRKAPPVSKIDLKGKTVLVIGANTGIGFEAVQHFATMGPKRLILACRSQEKGEAAIQRLEKATGYNQAELWLIDLAEFASVKAFADRALKELERLDIIVLNAALGTHNYSTTKDGWESSLQVNDLSMSLLALRLLPRITETAKKFDGTPRIVVVSSGVHYWSTLEDKVIESPNAFSLLSSKEFCTPEVIGTHYTDTKLLNLFFVRALSHHLKDQSIIVNAVDPGFCYSELRREITNIRTVIFEWLFARTAEEGARQLIWASAGFPKGGLEELKGAYIYLSDVQEPADKVLGEDGRKREDKLWNDLISILKEVDPRVVDVVDQYLK